MRQVAEEAREVDALRFNDEALAALERGARGSPVAGTALELFNCSRSREECRFVCVCVCYRCSFSVPDYCLGIFCNVKCTQVRSIF